MDYKYTNESLRKKFKSQFELVRYAISLAENMIITGREPRIKTDLQNRAMQVLAEIGAGKDQFEPVISEQKTEQKVEEMMTYKTEDANHLANKAPQEKKRTRKILMD